MIPRQARLRVFIRDEYPHITPGQWHHALWVREVALANVRKHAGAGRIDVSLRYDTDSVVLRVADDGCGFDLCAVSGGIGLSSMRTRVEQVGGGFTVRSAAGDGTVVEARL